MASSPKEFEELGRSVIDGALAAFRANKGWADKAVAQLPDEKLHLALDSNTNSIAVIMKHVAGNLLSRWTDFLTTDGEKPRRNRDDEFVDSFASRNELFAFWDSGWNRLLETLGSLTAEDLRKTVTIRGEAHSVPLAIQRSLAHCAYHVGQMVLIARILAGDKWETITIPRGGSAAFNQRTWGNRQDEQRRLIVEQFTKQAVPFSQMPHHNDEDTNRLVVETAGIGPDDTVLDVACGPGLITCAIARIARHVTGIDLTPAMIEEARKRQQSMGLTNMDWKVGDVLPLPFPESSFSAVITRYSFHHFLDPEAVLAEMVRVCQPGGTVAVVDVFMSTPEQAKAYNRMEKLRDSSHTRALLLEELTGMFHDAGLQEMKTAFYKLDVELEKLLTASCTKPDDAKAVRRIFEDDLDVDRLGVGANRQDDGIHFAFPIVVVAGQKRVI